MSVEHAEVFADRRERVARTLGDDAALILPAGPELRAGRDLELRYRPDPDLYYLTGYLEPEAVAVLCPAHAEAPFTLFVRPRDPERELWTGARGGPEAAKELFGADAAFPIGELDARLPEIVGAVGTLYFRLGSGRDDVEAAVRRVLLGNQKQRQRSGRGPRILADPGLILDEMRLIKDAHELEQLRRAARTTIEAVRAGAAVIRPGAGEWEVEAAIEATFRRLGGEGFGFQTIVAAGANATVLHYAANDTVMRDGDLVLIDAGARHHMYNGDISRTFPVSGRFTPEQRAVYDIVLAAKDAAVAAVRPGATVLGVHHTAVRVLVDGLVSLGLLRGDPAALAADEASYRTFYPHRTSHWLGLDVHDVGDYACRGEERPLEPGMVLTVEPGLYIPAAHADAPESFRGIGIRIEDDVVVTDDGCEILTAELPADPAAVEAMVGASGRR